MSRIAKKSQSFKFDFNSASIQYKGRDANDDVFSVSGYSVNAPDDSLICTGEFYAPTILYDAIDIINSEHPEIKGSDTWYKAEEKRLNEEQRKLNEEYNRRWDEGDKTVPNEDDVWEQFRPRYYELDGINEEFNNAVDNGGFTYSVDSVKINSFSMKCGWDGGGAELDEEYKDEVKASFMITVNTIYGQTITLKVKKDDCSFVPDDEATMYMQSYVETLNESDYDASTRKTKVAKMSYNIIVRGRPYEDWNYYSNEGYAVDTYEDSAKYESVEEAIRIKNQLASEYGGTWAVVEGNTDAETGKIYIIYDERYVDDDYDASTKKMKKSESVKKMQYGPDDFKVGDTWRKHGTEFFEVTDVREFWDLNHGGTYIAVGGWYEDTDPSGEEGFYEDTYWRLDKFNDWVQGAVKTKEGSSPVIPHYIENKNASTEKSYTPEYHDFRTMLTNMRVTKDNRTVLKR